MMIFHATAPFSLFCDDGTVARPFWRFADAEAMVAEFPEHSFRIFERMGDGSMRSIFYMPASAPDYPANPLFRNIDPTYREV